MSCIHLYNTVTGFVGLTTEKMWAPLYPSQNSQNGLCNTGRTLWFSVKRRQCNQTPKLPTSIFVTRAVCTRLYRLILSPQWVATQVFLTKKQGGGERRSLRVKLKGTKSDRIFTSLNYAGQRQRDTCKVFSHGVDGNHDVWHHNPALSGP